MLKIWDKKEPINGVSAERYLSNHPEVEGNSKIVLNCNDITGKVDEVLDAEFIMGVLGLPLNTDPVEAISKYISKREEENKKAADYNSKTEKLNKENAERISAMEFEIMKLSINNR